MIGLTSRTISASSVTSRRRTPWVAGWCGPKLSVSSSSVSSLPPSSGCSSGESVIDCSRRRYSDSVGLSVVGLIAVPRTQRSRYEVSRDGTRTGSRARLQPFGLVVGEDHRFAPDREVAPLGVALVVLGHQ